MNRTIAEPTFAIQAANERVCFDHGWLKTCHSFSFAQYQDEKNINWGALRVVNDDIVAPGKGFGAHEHHDMEILTYVLEGELEHRDSTGRRGVVTAGGAQYMSAGTGITHSELNHSQTDPLHFLQMWVYPSRKGIGPFYGDVQFVDEDRLNKWLVVASGRPNIAAPVKMEQDAMLLVTRLANGYQLQQGFEPDRLAFLYVAGGSVTSRGVDTAGNTVGSGTLEAGDAVRIAHIVRVEVQGNGLVVLWDVPPLRGGAQP